MLKFQNKVALNKITRLVEKSPLVIFFHCNNSALDQKQKNFSVIFKKKSVLYEQASQSLQIKAIKNSYLKKALLKKMYFQQSKESLSLTQGSYLVVVLKETSFFLLKDLFEDDSICFLGGIYKDHCIDHNQLSHLVKIIENDQIYHSSSTILKNQSILLPSLIERASRTRCDFSWLTNPFLTKLCFTISYLQKQLSLQEKNRNAIL